MASEQDRTPEQLLRLFNNEVETGLRLLRRMQREFSNQATTSGENTLDGRFADAIATLARILEQTTGVTLELANTVLQERMRSIRERERETQGS